MAQANPFDQFDTAPAPAGGPVYGAPPKAPDREPKTTWRTLSPDEVTARGLPGDKAYQISSEGKVEGLPTSDTKATVDQQKIATLLTRIAGGFHDIQGVTAADPSAQEPGLIESWRGGLSPEGMTGPIVRKMAGGNRRAVYDSQVDVLDALLTLGTGAAYNKEQLAGQTTSYFPQYGDTDAEKEIKNQRMRRLIEAAKQNAGPAWDKVAPAIEPLMQSLAVEDAAKKDDRKDDPPAGIGLSTDEGAGGPPPGETLIGHFRNQDGSLAPIYGKPGTALPPGAVPLTAEEQRQSGIDAQTAEIQGKPGLGDIAKNGLTLGLGDEAAGVGGAAGALLTGRDPIAAYQHERDLARQRLAQARENEGWLGTATDLVAGGASLGVAGLTAPTTPRTIASLAREGAGVGALAGYGNGEGAQGSLAGAATGGALGGVIGAGGGKISDILASRPVPITVNDGAAVMQAADRLNSQFGTKIAPLPADVGGPGVRMATGATATLPLGARPIVKGAEAVSAEAQKARDAIASLAGAPSGQEAAGEAALNGARKYITASRNRVNALYEKARALGGDQPVDLATARTVLDQNIAELSHVPGGAPGLADLQALRAEFDKPFPVEGVRSMRTVLRDRFLKDGLRGSDLERRVGQVVDAADQDITTSLSAAGKTEAARAYAEAAAAHKDRVSVIDQILAPIIGNKGDAPKSGEQIMAAIGQATQRNNARLGKFLNSLPDEDAATVRSTLISGLGRASRGTQNAEGDAFSLPQFLTHWNTITPEAKRTLFGPQLRSALDDLAKVAEGTKEAQRFENSSKTGAAVGQLATGALMGRAISNPLMTVAGLATQYGLGRLLSSPSFARWIAKVPNIQPSAMPAYIRKLSTVAAADAAIAADARGLQQTLLQAFSQSPTRAAAGDQEQDRRGVPPN